MDRLVTKREIIFFAAALTIKAKDSDYPIITRKKIYRLTEDQFDKLILGLNTQILLAAYTSPGKLKV